MLGLADGTVAPTAPAVKHIDLCLDCRACETACPSGVVYHELLEETRAQLRQHSSRINQATGAQLPRRSLSDRAIEWLFLNMLTHPFRLKVSLLAPRLLQKLGIYPLLRKTGLFNILPPGLRKMEQMLPPRGPLWPRRMPERVAAAGSKPGESDKPKVVVAFLPGCVGSVMFARVNQMAVQLLADCGADVVIPRNQGCCGAMHHHAGLHAESVKMARQNIIALEQADFITSTIAGCGAMLREYDVLFRDDASYADRARHFAAKVRDISEVLLQLGLNDFPHPVHETITYHDACHLVHAQKVAAAPRALLAMVKGLKLAPLAESEMCCGAAGTYNLTQPVMATDLAERKVRHIEATACRTCATGNVGCAMHIQSHALQTGRELSVVHPIEILHRARFGS